MPPLATTMTPLDSSQQGITQWPDGNTAAGGQGGSFAGVQCEASETFHIHAHLTIFRDGVQLAVPAEIGIVPSCRYALHTHDRSGLIHVEAAAPVSFTLGQFFALWGQTLSASNVAGLSDPNIAFYVRDPDAGTGLQRFEGDPATIPLAAHREITIQIGSAPAEVPIYDWSNL
ncbi:hypothetical protein [Caldimonas sp. KR1-144]|uniref:hypothetical protein n=1 Tax=Caldimonas sp. KR1-144 TaxID=3400911 RepID=UPI003C028FA2